MNLKEKVDNYLLKYAVEIQTLQDNKTLRWAELIPKILVGTDKIHILNSEYIRNRWRKLKEKVGNQDLKQWLNERSWEDKEVKNIDRFHEYTLTSTAQTSKFLYQSGKEDKTKGAKEFTFTADNIPTEEEIVEHFNIDTKKWKIVNIYHKTSFGGKYSITVQTNLLKGVEAGNYTEKFDKFIENYNKTIFINKPVSEYKEQIEPKDCLYLISLADLHIGNYQKDGYLESIKDKLIHTINTAKEFGVEKVIILNTGDMLHTNGSKETTLGGTQLDSQEPFEDSFTQGLELITSTIDYAASLQIKTVFVNVRGNHSFDTEYCLGEAVKRVYKGRKDVEVLNQRDTRIYYYWNNNAFLFTHGDKAMERLPLLFATEGKEFFQKADNHHIILGHLHHNKGKQFINDRAEFAGIEVRVLGSPTSNDIWHKQNGFCQNKKAVIGMLFTPSQGKYAEFNFKM